MTMRYGLQARVMTVLLVVLLVTLAVIGLVLKRQEAMGEEMLDQAGGAMHGLVYTRLRGYGEAQVERLARNLVNPLYYFDLEAMGQVIGNVQRQPDVDYLVVFSAAGEVIHDGSREIATFGYVMDDALGAGTIAALAPTSQTRGNVYDVSAPILMGGERLGGVRIGYSLDSIRLDEEAATAGLRASLEDIARNHAGWIAMLLSVLVVLAGAMVLLVHRSLVHPVRRLAGAARGIEAGDFKIGRAS